MRKLMILGVILLASMGLQAAEEFGIASYYSDAFHGRKTASGELYHKDKLTAAHKTLPFGTIIKVTRLDNKTSVQVKINDRGPYIKGRIVDLSKAAAKKLDLIRDGKARVKIEIISKGEEDLVTGTASIPNLKSLRSDGSDSNVEKGNTPSTNESLPSEFAPKTAERIVPKAPSPEVKPEPKAPTKAKSIPDLRVTKAAPKKEAAPKKVAEPKKLLPATSGTLVKGQDFKPYDLYKIQLMRPQKGGFGVQVASMTQYENVMKHVSELQEKWFNNILVSIEEGKNKKPIYKLILGPFPDRVTADSYKKDLKTKKKIDGFVVDLSKLNN